MIRRIALKLYGRLEAHRRQMWWVLSLILVLALLLLPRLRTSEDITDFLPDDGSYEKIADVLSKMEVTDNILITVSSDNEYEMMDAADSLNALLVSGEAARHVSSVRAWADPGEIMSVLRFVSGNLPCYADMSSIDSLISRENVSMALDRAMQSLTSFQGMVSADILGRDPLMLSSAAMQDVRNLAPDGGFTQKDGYIFNDDGELCVIVQSAYPQGETAGNKKLINAVDGVVDKVSAMFPGCSIEAFGAPYVSVLNASTIKEDSLRAVVISAVLLIILLAYTYGSARPLLLLGASLLFGVLCSLALLSIISPDISIIALGIGSVLIGIAANYPLHYIDHRAEGYGPSQTVVDISQPLTIGNITTVGAFLSLVFISSPAMKGLGLYAAFMLVFTMVFVLVFLPHAGGCSGLRRRPLVLKTSAGTKSYIPLAFVAALTVVLWLVSYGADHFNGNLSEINYMTPRYREKMAELTEQTSGGSRMFFVAEGKDFQEALENHWKVRHVLDSLSGEGVSVAGPGSLLPPASVCIQRAAEWNAFWEPRAEEFVEMFESLAREKGFSDGAFAPFLDAVRSEAVAADVSELCDSPVSSFLAGNYVVTMLGGFSGSIGGDGYWTFDNGTMMNGLVGVLERDFDKVLYICSLLVLVFLFVSFGRVELVLVAFLPLFVGWIWILGIMELIGVDFNIVNIILATFIFGMGDDYTIFMLEGAVYEYTYGRKMLRTYKETIALSALTMFIGIGSLIVSRHPAMKSLAEVTIIGMGVVVAMAYIIPGAVFRFLTVKRGAARRVPVTLASMSRTVATILFVIICAPVVSVGGFVAVRILRVPQARYRMVLTSIMRFCTRHFYGMPFEFDNRTGEDFSKPAVVICNHQSQLDIMLMMAVSSRLSMVMNDWSTRLYSPFVGFAGFIPASGLSNNLDTVRKAVAEGNSIMIFPEGTRSRDCSIGRFHKGAFMLARELGLDVVCMMVHGSAESLPKGSTFIEKAPLYCGVLKRIPCGELSEDDRVTAKEIRQYYAREYTLLRDRNEDEVFFRSRVAGAFRYKGASAEADARAACRRNALDGLRGQVSEGRLDMVDNGYGALALTAALVMRDVQVYARITDHQRYLMAVNIACIPDNLHFVSDGGDVVVAGGGMGGLVSAALLASSGMKVTVLEKQAHSGGGLGTFVKDGYRFDVGVHTAYGFGEMGAFGKVCRRLGIDSGAVPVPAGETFETVFADGVRYDLPAGRKAFEGMLEGIFPNCGLGAYLDYVYATAARVPSGGDADMDAAIWLYTEKESLKDVLDRFVTDDKLKRVLSWVTLYTGLPAEESLFSLSALVTVLMVEESCRLEKGVAYLRESIESVIRSAGGEIRTGMPVVGFDVAGGLVKSVRCRNGERITAGTFLSSLPLKMMEGMLPQEVFRKIARKVSKRVDGVSFFSVYAAMQDGIVPQFACPVNIDGRIVVIPYTENGMLRSVQIHSLMGFSEVEEWADTVRGRRQEAYLDFKDKHRDRLLDIVESVLPGLRSGIARTFCATPLTVRDYLGRESVYGTLPSVSSGLPLIGNATSLPNLFLTGGEIRFHGLCGVPASAIDAAEQILYSRNLAL